MKQIVLNPKDLLVTRLSDYFTKVEKGKLNTAIDKDDTYTVGIVEHVGNGLPQEWVGKVVYYHKNIGIEVNLKGIGKFDLIQSDTKLLIRMDQNRRNY